MIDLIPEFDAYRVFVEPWTVNLSQTLLITSIGLIVALSSALVGNYLVLRRMSMLGDAISHSALPGIVIAFLISGSRDSFALTVGAADGRPRPPQGRAGGAVRRRGRPGFGHAIGSHTGHSRL